MISAKARLVTIEVNFAWIPWVEGGVKKISVMAKCEQHKLSQKHLSLSWTSMDKTDWPKWSSNLGSTLMWSTLPATSHKHFELILVSHLPTLELLKCINMTENISTQ